MESTDDIALFFRDPCEEPRLPGTFGILYLLRRDINDCIYKKRTQFLGAMGIFAGIDLLAKFLAGSDAVGRLGPRFRAFVAEYLKPLTSEDAESIYQARNALIHSFGLYSEKRRGKRVQKYHFGFVSVLPNALFVPVPPDALPVERNPTGSDEYLINLFVLWGRFEQAIHRYHTDLESSAELRTHFGAMFPKYGSLGIGVLPVR